MRTISIWGVHSTKKHNSYLDLIFFRQDVIQLGLQFYLYMRIKYDDSKNQNSSIEIYIPYKIYVNSGLFICPTKNTLEPNTIL